MVQSNNLIFTDANRVSESPFLSDNVGNFEGFSENVGSSDRKGKVGLSD